MEDFSLFLCSSDFQITSFLKNENKLEEYAWKTFAECGKFSNYWWLLSGYFSGFWCGLYPTPVSHTQLVSPVQSLMIPSQLSDKHSGNLGEQRWGKASVTTLPTKTLIIPAVSMSVLAGFRVRPVFTPQYFWVEPFYISCFQLKKKKKQNAEICFFF